MICDPKTNEPKYRLVGSWLSHIDIEKYDPKKKSWGNTQRIYEQIWVGDEEDEEWDKLLRMNDIAINLNYTDDELEKVLPPTDSRRRPDMRAMERGDYETADREKKRLEEE